MEKFEFEEKKGLELFSNFAGRTKDALAALIDGIKESITNYGTKIEDTTKEIEENELSREKCEHEITKMEEKIEGIKDAIENVENTYKKIADAYSSTSKGETKEIYSEIIDGARANCEKDVEKNRSEIARLNSDIEAIKNNISEFTKVIDGLNKDLENYNTELFRYNKALEYMEKLYEKTVADLDDISIKTDTKKSEPAKTSTKKTETKKSTSKPKTQDKEVEETDEDSSDDETSANIIDTIEKETFQTIEEESEEKPEQPTIEVEEPKAKEETEEVDPLQQIYDLTGYQPASKEEKKEGEAETKADIDNLESLFKEPEVEGPKIPTIESVEEPKAESPILDGDFTNWESILNTPTSEPVEEKKDDLVETVDQLLNPYGTTFDRLKDSLGDAIYHKDGIIEKFDMTKEDVIAAINAVDGNDLKAMKIVGPEITLLRKVKSMKEGK